MVQFSLPTHSLNPPCLSFLSGQQPNNRGYQQNTFSFLSGQQPNNSGYQQSTFYRQLQSDHNRVNLSPGAVVPSRGRTQCGIQGEDFFISPENPASSSKEPYAAQLTPYFLTDSTFATPLTPPPPTLDTDDVPWTPIGKRGGFIASLAKWRARLITKDDFIHVHTISTSVLLLFLLHNEGLLFTTVATTGKIWEPENWAVIVVPLCVAAIVSQLSGIMLATQFRYGAERRTFIGSAVVNLCTIPIILAATECWPQALTFSSTPLPTLTFVFLSLSTLYQSVADTASMLKSRRIAWSTAPGHVSVIQGYILYALPVSIGPLLQMPALKIFLAFTPEWASTFQQHHPEYYPFLFQMACHVLILGLVPLFGVTLRDKKLIRPRLEMVFTSFPVLVPVAFVTWAWNQYSDWVPGLFMNVWDLTGPLPI